MSAPTQVDSDRVTLFEWFADLAKSTLPYLLVIPGLVFVLGVLGYAVYRRVCAVFQ